MGVPNHLISIGYLKMGGGGESEFQANPLWIRHCSVCVPAQSGKHHVFQCQINNLTAVLLLCVNGEQKKRRLDCAV